MPAGVTRRRGEALPYPRWEQERWHREQTVFGARDDELSYEYLDRLDPKRERAARAKADASGAEKRSADWFSALISAYEGRKLKVRHVTACVDGAGNPVYCLGYGPERRRR